MAKAYAISDETIERLKKLANDAWGEIEYEEHYEDAVTCGNGDDTFGYGHDQGQAELALEILIELGVQVD